MKTRTWSKCGALAVLLVASAAAVAQVPVDERGQPLGSIAPETDTYEDVPLLTEAELAELVSPIALYPDDLLAIVLPAATYPLQVVEAGRFLDALGDDPSLEPDPDWDDSVVALVNYPEVVELLNDDLDWTWQLGEAVISQQAGVIAAVESFRDRAYAAGNLRSDDFQRVTRDDGIIEIEPLEDDVIYVPYYEPERVVVYQPTPVYHYYPAPRPVYYYPYPTSHAFDRGYFWGVTTAFTIGWASDRVRVYHVSYDGHPYYGRYYHDRWWYRRPPISVHRSIYIDNSVRVSHRHRGRGDYWRPSRHTRLRYSDQRISRSRYFQERRPRVRRTTVHRSYDARRKDRILPPNHTPNRHTIRPDRKRDVMRDQRRRSSPQRLAANNERHRSSRRAGIGRSPERTLPSRASVGGERPDAHRLRKSHRDQRRSNPPARDTAHRRTDRQAAVGRSPDRSMPNRASAGSKRRDANRQRSSDHGQRQSQRPAPKAARAERAPRSDRRRERRDGAIRKKAQRQPR